MKHNFIQNLSDEVVRQNYQLKTNLQIIKNQLKDFQWQMVEFISQATTNINIYDDIFQVFKQFTQLVKDKFNQVENLKSHIAHLRQKYQQIQKQEISVINDLNKKKNEQEALKRNYQTKLAHKQKDIKQLNGKIQQLTSNNNNLIQQMCEARIEKLKLEQAIRKQIEQAKKIQNNQFNQFRQKDEQEHLSVYNQLKKDIQLRDKTIRDMSRSIALLTNSIDINNSQKILQDIFRSFQKFEQLSESYRNLKKQNEELRNQAKSLFNRLVAQQSKLQQAKQVEYNLLNQLQRSGLQKRELQAKIVATMNELSKCNFDKASMQEYYDMKWNDQFQNVKLKLERSFQTKMQAFKKECDKTIEESEGKVRQADRQRNYFAQRAKELIHKCNQGEAERKKLQEVIALANDKIKDLQQVNYESARMHHEELRKFKVIFQRQLGKQQKDASQRQSALQSSIQVALLRYQQVTAQLQKIKQSCLRQQQKYEQLIEQQKKTLAYYQAQQVEKLKAQIQKQKNLIPSIKAEVQEQMTNKFQITLDQKNKAIQLKQEEYAANNQRWIDKYCELQNLLSFIRQKLQHQISSQRQQIKLLLSKQQRLHAEKEELKIKINCLMAQVKSLQAEIYNNKMLAVEKQNKMIALQKEITSLKIQIEILIASKKAWKQQLTQFQKQFFKQLHHLNTINQSTANKLKDKIRQLQDLNRQNCRNRREKIKIQALSNERLSLKQEIAKKQSQNKILHQVKDYYEVKLKEADRQIGKYQFKNTHVILTRRLKKDRLQTNQTKSHRIFSPRESLEKKKYEITSVKKKFEVSASNITLKDNERKYRRQTMTSLK